MREGFGRMDLVLTGGEPGCPEADARGKDKKDEED
jgi:hypothetical protein